MQAAEGTSQDSAICACLRTVTSTRTRRHAGKVHCARDVTSGISFGRNLGIKDAAASATPLRHDDAPRASVVERTCPAAVFLWKINAPHASVVDSHNFGSFNLRSKVPLQGIRN